MERAFTHRFNNADGTVDSICHQCFAKVATASREGDLQIPELRHTCSPESKLRIDLLHEAAKVPRLSSSDLRMTKSLFFGDLFSHRSLISQPKIPQLPLSLGAFELLLCLFEVGPRDIPIVL